MILMICTVDNCGRACAPGETVCRKHGGDPLACGICGNVDCQGHQLIQVEKSLAELADEIRAADLLAGPSPTSRDWFRCTFCYRKRGVEVACSARITIGTGFDWWSCPSCHVLFSSPRDLTLDAGLTRWEWSLVRHAGCNVAWGHQTCLPDVWLSAMAVTPDGYAVEGPLGRLELPWRLQRGVSNPPSLRSV
jgi:hypothetical protein